MTKTYINNAVIGNSSMLACLNDKGELIRLFWPHIDYPQHVERINTGIFFLEQKHSTVWLESEAFRHEQQYVPNTNILETVFTNNEKGLKVRQMDFCLHDKDVLIRHYEIENLSNNEMDLGFIVYSAFITTTPDLRSTLFDFVCEAMIHYRHGYYVSISAEKEAYQFQLGNNAYESAQNTELNGYDAIGMMPDGAVSWKLGSFKPGEKKTFMISICASNTLKGVKKLIGEVKDCNFSSIYEDTKEYWLNFINKAKRVETGRKDIDDIYIRSLLVFKLMADGKSGGLLAAPEIDENFTKCGRYAYCWGRDAAFITSALDECGLTDAVDSFYSWAVNAQDEDGSWHQRYHMDGNLAPSWGMQIDETGTLIWGMLKHYEITRDERFLSSIWDCVQKGVGFLLSFMDEDTGLTRPSYDLWEERVGEHTYSCSAVYGGIKAAAKIAQVLKAPEELVLKWESAAAALKDAIERNFWKEDRKCFLRSVRTKLNPWGSEYSSNTVIIKANPKGYLRDVTLEDGTVDVSLIGVCVPFEVFGADDNKIENTVETIERVLTANYTGGIKRYENDNYIGGNPWVLTTLWVALYHIKKKNFEKAKEYFEWAVKARTGLDLLPEQVSKDDGKPIWVIPLTWSHAMFILVLMELMREGAL